MSVSPTEIKKQRKRLSQRPHFRRFESWRYKRVKQAWRRPKGIDNRMLEKKRGYPPLVSVGYRTPRKIRGFHPSGYREVVVHNLSDLEIVDPQTQAVRIARTVGRKKRSEVMSQAEVYGIHILNPTYSGIQLEEAIGDISLDTESDEGLRDVSLEDLADFDEEE